MQAYTELKKIKRLWDSWKKEKHIKQLVRNGLQLGKDVQFIDNYFIDPSHCFLISIGDNCTICPNVRLIAHDASTKKALGYTKIGKITIRENCFIGDSVIVLPNVTIGPNSIIGAGTVVTRDIPEGVVAAGNPARVLLTIKEYLEKISKAAGTKRIFDETYLIGNLTEEKRKEVLNMVEDSIGFIV
mgnify:CR=1 FL=1